MLTDEQIASFKAYGILVLNKRSARRSGRRHLAMYFVPKPQKAADTDMLVQNHRVVLEAIEGYQYSWPQRIFTEDSLHSEYPRI